MELVTHPRGQLDTAPSRLGRWLVLAIILHAPASPLIGNLIGLSQLFARTEEGPPPPPITEIPLEIFEDDSASAMAAVAPPDAPSAPEAAVEGEVVPAAPPPKPPPKPAAPKPKPADASAPDAGSAGAPSADDASVGKPQPEAEAADAGTDASRGEPKADAGVEPVAAAERKPGDGIADPAAGIGNRKVVDPNANVRVVVHNDRVRQHPLGARIGPLLRNVNQWRDFFGPTALDPIRDIDRMLIVGPQLRDSRGVVAILQFNVPQARVRQAISALVERDPEGGWLDTAVPEARARADGGQRLFIMPSPQVLVVTPPSAQKSVERLPKTFRLPKPQGPELATAHLETPWRAFIGLPVVIPKSIRSADLRLTPSADGGAVIDLLALDETEPLARDNAAQLTRAVQAATQLDLGLFGSVLFGTSKKRFVEKVSFYAEETQIHGEIVLTAAQLDTLIGFAASALGADDRRRPRAVPSAASSAP